MGSKRWKNEEKEMIKELYPDTLSSEIAEKMNRPVKQIYMMATFMGLKKSQAFKDSTYSGIISKLNNYVGVIHRFKKGNVPFNKGLKRKDYTPAESIAKCKRTQFFKGQTPHNHKPVGTTVTNSEGYLVTKISEPNNWRKTHHLKWEAENGPIPLGMILMFKDGIKQNIELENLVLRTRYENLKLNRKYNYSPELRVAIKLIKKLEKTINTI